MPWNWRGTPQPSGYERSGKGQQLGDSQQYVLPKVPEEPSPSLDTPPSYYKSILAYNHFLFIHFLYIHLDTPVSIALRRARTGLPPPLLLFLETVFLGPMAFFAKGSTVRFRRQGCCKHRLKPALSKEVILEFNSALTPTSQKRKERKRKDREYPLNALGSFQRAALSSAGSAGTHRLGVCFCLCFWPLSRSLGLGQTQCGRGAGDRACSSCFYRGHQSFPGADSAVRASPRSRSAPRASPPSAGFSF